MDPGRNGLISAGVWWVILAGVVRFLPVWKIHAGIDQQEPRRDVEAEHQQDSRRNRNGVLSCIQICIGLNHAGIGRDSRRYWEGFLPILLSSSKDDIGRVILLPISCYT